MGRAERRPVESLHLFYWLTKDREENKERRLTHTEEERYTKHKT